MAGEGCPLQLGSLKSGFSSGGGEERRARRTAWVGASMHFVFPLSAFDFEIIGIPIIYVVKNVCLFALALRSSMAVW